MHTYFMNTKMQASCFVRDTAELVWNKTGNVGATRFLVTIPLTG